MWSTLGFIAVFALLLALVYEMLDQNKSLQSGHKHVAGVVLVVCLTIAYMVTLWVRHA